MNIIHVRSILHTYIDVYFAYTLVTVIVTVAGKLVRFQMYVHVYETLCSDGKRKIEIQLINEQRKKIKK